jgi:hypothetical protein
MYKIYFTTNDNVYVHKITMLNLFCETSLERHIVYKMFIVRQSHLVSFINKCRNYAEYRSISTICYKHLWWSNITELQRKIEFKKIILMHVFNKGVINFPREIYSFAGWISNGTVCCLLVFSNLIIHLSFVTCMTDHCYIVI